MKHTKALLFLIIAVAANRTVHSEKHTLPNYVHICHKTNPMLNECLQKTIESLRPHLAIGIPEMGIPSCDPLVIPKIAISQNAGAMNLNSEYTNITVHGSSNFILKNVRVDPHKNRMRLRLWFPELRTKSTYNIQGNLLMMPLKGNGTSHGNYSDVDAIAAIRGEIIEKSNEKYFKVKDLFVEFNIGNASIHLDNLFNGDAELGATMNKFLNEHWRLIAGEMRPALEDAIGDLLFQVADKLFSKYPIRVLLPE